jgi:hypothetical protein
MSAASAATTQTSLCRAMLHRTTRKHCVRMEGIQYSNSLAPSSPKTPSYGPPVTALPGSHVFPLIHFHLGPVALGRGRFAIVVVVVVVPALRVSLALLRTRIWQRPCRWFGGSAVVAGSAVDGRLGLLRRGRSLFGEAGGGGADVEVVPFLDGREACLDRVDLDVLV